MDHSSLMYILGAGGHAKVVLEALLSSQPEVRPQVRDLEVKGLGAVLGHAVHAPLLPESPMGLFHVAIGSNAARQRVFEQAQTAGLVPATVMHALAQVSPSAQVGAGSLCTAFSIVGPQARVGCGVIINHGAVVDHDCEVGDFTHVSPLVSLAGGVRVGRRVLLGAGARVLPGLSICDDAIIGAGAVVIESIEQPGTWVGVPARRVK